MKEKNNSTKQLRIYVFFPLIALQLNRRTPSIKLREFLKRT